MTEKQFIDTYLDFLEIISEQGYSQYMMETASNMLLLIPIEKRAEAIKKFIEIAQKGLIQKDFHYEIGLIFKTMMGYQTNTME